MKLFISGSGKLLSAFLFFIASSCDSPRDQTDQQNAEIKARESVEKLASPRIIQDTLPLSALVRRVKDSTLTIASRRYALDELRKNYPEYMAEGFYSSAKPAKRKSHMTINEEIEQNSRDQVQAVDYEKLNQHLESQKDQIVKKWRAVAAQANYEATIQAQQQKQ